MNEIDKLVDEIIASSRTKTVLLKNDDQQKLKQYIIKRVSTLFSNIPKMKFCSTYEKTCNCLEILNEHYILIDLHMIETVILSSKIFYECINNADVINTFVYINLSEKAIVNHDLNTAMFFAYKANQCSVYIKMSHDNLYLSSITSFLVSHEFAHHQYINKSVDDELMTYIKEHKNYLRKLHSDPQNYLEQMGFSYDITKDDLSKVNEVEISGAEAVLMYMALSISCKENIQLFHEQKNFDIECYCDIFAINHYIKMSTLDFESSYSLALNALLSIYCNNIFMQGVLTSKNTKTNIDTRIGVVESIMKYLFPEKKHEIYRCTKRYYESLDLWNSIIANYFLLPKKVDIPLLIDSSIEMFSEQYFIIQGIVENLLKSSLHIKLT